MPPVPQSSLFRRSIRVHLMLGIGLMLLAGGTVASWGITTQIAGAVIAEGRVVVQSNSKKVQHPGGGVIGELLVKNGDTVKAGDLLLRLDETQTRANLTIIQSSLDELLMRQARLEAEKDGASAIMVPRELETVQSQETSAALVTGEVRLFELRRESREGQKAQLQERIIQLEQEVIGLFEQQTAKDKEIAFIRRELKGIQTLWNQQLIPLTRLMQLEREAARLEGQRGQYLATIAQARGKIAETRLSIIQIDQDLRSSVAQEISEVRGKISELRERLVAAEDQLRRIDIRAPQTGVVHQLAVHTVGGVIGPGELIMLIIPQDDVLEVETKVNPGDVDQVYVSQVVSLRLSAFRLEETPELTGSIRSVSADLTIDEKTGASFYTARIMIPTSELSKLDGLALVPGMPVEAFIRTEDRTVVSYLIKPLSDQVAKAFRD